MGSYATRYPSHISIGHDTGPAGHDPEIVGHDPGPTGHVGPKYALKGIQVLRSGQKRGISRTLHAMIMRRSAIEPTIGHMKSDGRLARNWLKGALCDALHAVLCGADHNIRLLLKKLRLLFAWITSSLNVDLAGRPGNQTAALA